LIFGSEFRIAKIAMETISDQILHLLQEEELLRLAKRAQMAGNMPLAQFFLNEYNRREAKHK